MADRTSHWKEQEAALSPSEPRARLLGGSGPGGHPATQGHPRAHSPQPHCHEAPMAIPCLYFLAISSGTFPAESELHREGPYPIQGTETQGQRHLLPSHVFIV